MGAYNAILYADERVNGRSIQEAEVRDFSNFLSETGLTEMKTIGRNFTWTNGQILSKIDRALVNSD